MITSTRYQEIHIKRCILTEKNGWQMVEKKNHYMLLVERYIRMAITEYSVEVSQNTRSRAVCHRTQLPHSWVQN